MSSDPSWLRSFELASTVVGSSSLPSAWIGDELQSSLARQLAHDALFTYTQKITTLGVEVFAMVPGFSARHFERLGAGRAEDIRVSLIELLERLCIFYILPGLTQEILWRSETTISQYRI